MLICFKTNSSLIDIHRQNLGVMAFSVFAPSLASSPILAYHYIALCNNRGQGAGLCQQGHSACMSVSAYICSWVYAPAYL